MVDFAKYTRKKKRIDLNPSSADRWTTCTASPKYIFDNWHRIPPEDRKFADPGTSAHEVAAAFLQNRAPNLAQCPAPIDEAMRWHGWNYAEFVEGLIEPGGKLLVEQRLPLFYAESRNCIVDAAVINPSNLHVVDYKYGEGVTVSPEDNLQATIYATSVVWASSQWNRDARGVPKPLELADDFPVYITIYQPRARSAAPEDGPAKTWFTTWGDIWERAHTIFDTAVNILAVTDPINPRPYNLEFKPTDKGCQFCPAKGFCEARPALLTKDLEPLAVIDDAPKPLGQVLTETQLAAIVKHGDHLIKWIKDAQAYALQYMKGGGKIPGFKLVNSRGGNRFWTDPKLAAKLLLSETILRPEEIFEQTVIGPAGVEKLLGKGKFPTKVYNLIGKPPGQPKIAPADDPREECLIDGATEFEALPDEDASKRNLEDF